MKKNVWMWELIGFAVVSLGGTLLHFLYEWLDGAIWVAPFSGVNESTFEHMKLMFWPMLAFAIVQSFFFKGREDFWCIKLKGTLIGLSLVPLIFYTYNGVIGKSADWVNIAIFFISAAVAYLYETSRFNLENTACKRPQIAFFLFLLLAVLFVIFTFATPGLALFRDPLTGDYGI